MDLGDYLLVTLLNGLLVGAAAGLSPSVRRIDVDAMLTGGSASVLAAILVPMLFPGGVALGLMMSVVTATLAVAVLAPRLREGGPAR